ncbi:ethanolamine ammonia-lyase light chain [Humitalea rosea]|uniref:Ethanolamine ammonia-lyase small subunit n=1 Tax=Humitalea rosea TaxID=990373 RepID=A0A2W7IIE7_9PROT|nr:ethanolamine ammonia-lyase subunit EutC [Humitalea rosea]PZW46590.1 ethanolamine ammonia-lyase light chain [Humitalea rosea]
MAGDLRLWRDLRGLTQARVALGRVGTGVPTAAHLAFQADHAAARDAVWSALDVPALLEKAGAIGLTACRVASEVPDRRAYLLRPDLGRRLRPEGRATLPEAAGCVVFVVADGLCARGVQTQAMAVIAACLPSLAKAGFAVGPVVIAEQARVAIGDEIGAAMRAAATVVLIGERPGLSVTDSLGAYLTWAPRPGRTDADRNCISNIRAAGLPPLAAAAKIFWLLAAARRLNATGVMLKDEQPDCSALSASQDPVLTQETE